MRKIATLHFSELVGLPPDTVATFALSVNTPIAQDWPAGTNMARLTGLTTLGAALGFYFQDGSTKATFAGSSVFSSGTSVSSQNNSAIFGSKDYQIPGGSTGFSLVAGSSGQVTVECWSR